VSKGKQKSSDKNGISRMVLDCVKDVEGEEEKRQAVGEGADETMGAKLVILRGKEKFGFVSILYNVPELGQKRVKMWRGMQGEA